MNSVCFLDLEVHAPPTRNVKVYAKVDRLTSWQFHIPTFRLTSQLNTSSDSDNSIDVKLRLCPQAEYASVLESGSCCILKVNCFTAVDSNRLEQVACHLDGKR